MNFYAMENNGGTGWSPILGQGNFHRSSRFGRVTWSTKESLAAAADAGAPSADGGTKDGGAGDAGRSSDGGAAAPARDAGLLIRRPPPPPALGTPAPSPTP